MGKFERNENIGVASSIERGSRLHEKISEMITQKWVIPSEVRDQKDREILSWVKESLETFRSKNGQFFSEKPIKFSLFGQIVSGIVDLAMVYQNQQATSLEIWDFKTGSSREKEDFYWFQLFCYAYAFSTRYSFSEKQSITVAISYVDRREIIKKRDK